METLLLFEQITVSGGQRQQDEMISEIKEALSEFYGEKIAEHKDYGRIINQRHFECVWQSLFNDNQPLLVV